VKSLRGAALPIRRVCRLQHPQDTRLDEWTLRSEAAFNVGRCLIQRLDRHAGRKPERRIEHIPGHGQRLTTAISWLLQATLSGVMTYKFHVGETVALTPSTSRNIPGGVYQVTKRLPNTGGECEYRIKSATEPHERVARESELTRA
jgi:hypothetical protein